MVTIINKSERCFVCAIDYRDPEDTKTIVYEGTLGLEVIEKGKKYQMINISEHGGFQVKFPFIMNTTRKEGKNIMSIDELKGTIFNVMWENPRQIAMVVRDEREIDGAMEFLKKKFYTDKAESLGLSVREIEENEKVYQSLPIELRKEMQKAIISLQKGDPDAEYEVKRLNQKVKDHLLEKKRKKDGQEKK